MFSRYHIRCSVYGWDLLMTSDVLTVRNEMVPFDFGSNKTVIRYRLNVRCCTLVNATRRRYCWTFLSDHLQSICQALQVRGERATRLLTADGDLNRVGKQNADMEWKSTWAACLGIIWVGNTDVSFKTLWEVFKRTIRTATEPVTASTQVCTRFH